MKAYLYYSKNKITRINNVELVRQELAKSITKTFDLFNAVSGNDVEINCVKISNEIDVFLVLDTNVDVDSNDLVGRMNRLKSELSLIIQKDQGATYQYKIRTKVDPNYTATFETISENNNVTTQVANQGGEDSELDYEKRSKAYVPVEPSYSFDRVILPVDVINKIEEALGILQYEKKVFDEWGLYEIQPHPSSSLSFFGPSGTGKTMAAEAVAQKLGKKILKVSYADVESKYHGEGPKMVKAIFLAAKNSDAVLFFDEADSLLSKRLTNVSQGSEQAINSMRSQLLICLEEFRGIVIFATNLVINYDQAFLTRLISIEFKKPDVDTRRQIWDVHINPVSDGKKHRINIPLADDVDTRDLAEKYDFAGREIRNAVISACINVAMADASIVSQSDFINACEKIVQEKESVANAGDHTIDAKGKETLKNAFIAKIKEKEETGQTVPEVSISSLEERGEEVYYVFETIKYRTEKSIFRFGSICCIRK